MIAVVAAGGRGTRFRPVTQWINKHLIPVDDGKLMIDYPLCMMRDLGFDEVTVVTGCEHAGQISEYIQDGERYGYQRVNYVIQSKPDGIAGVVRRSTHLVDQQGMLLVLGDNFFSDSMQLDIRRINFDRAIAWEYDVVHVEMAKAFGQINRNRFGQPCQIVEKPEMPEHSRILTGLYYFPHDVCRFVEALEPSKRNELEITDLLSMYLDAQRLEVISVEGAWRDLGEWSSLSKFVCASVLDPETSKA